MPIHVSCDQCEHKHKVKTKLAGTRFRCKECDFLILVPSPDDAPVVSEARWQVEERVEQQPAWSPPSKNHRRQSYSQYTWWTLISVAVGISIAAIALTLGKDNGEAAQHENPISASTLPNESTDELREQDFQSRQPDWRDLTVPGQPISVSMPGPPKKMIHQQDGQIVRSYSVQLDSHSGALSIMYVDYKESPERSSDVISHFEDIKQGMLSSIPESKLTSERSISIADEGGHLHPGRELQIDAAVQGQDIHLIYRLYLVGTKLVTAFASMDQQHSMEFQSQSTRFFDSLKITDAVSPASFGE